MKTNQDNGTLTIWLEGRIDSNNAAQTEAELLSAVASAPDAGVTLDAERLEYISSAGLRVLMKLRKTVGKPVEVVNVRTVLPSVPGLFWHWARSSSLCWIARFPVALASFWGSRRNLPRGCSGSWRFPAMASTCG